MEAVLNKTFNSAQVDLIQLLAQDLDKEELTELRKVLVQFRFKMVTERANRIAAANGWEAENINAISQEHFRTSSIQST